MTGVATGGAHAHALFKVTIVLLMCVAVLMMLIEVLGSAAYAAQDRLSDEIYKITMQYQNWFNRHGPRF